MSDTDDACRRGAALFEEGKYSEAAEIFRKLAERIDLPFTERTYMASNLAKTYDKLNLVDEAAQTYEFGSSVALRLYVWAQEERAEYLYHHQRVNEAVEIWEHLLTLDLLMPDRAEAMRHNLNLPRDPGKR